VYLVISSSFSCKLRITDLLRHRNALQAAIKNPITSHPPLHPLATICGIPTFPSPNPTLSLIICQHSTDSTYTSDVAFRIIALNNQNFYCAGHGAKNLTWSSNHASSSLSWSRQCPWSHSVRLSLFSCVSSLTQKNRMRMREIGWLSK
jgi:hypothetical protein